MQERGSGGGKFGGEVPAPRDLHRLVGVGPEGRRVDNVNAKNRYSVDQKHPWVRIHLMSEDLTRLVAEVYIPNTRERPDAVMYQGRPFGVVSTLLPVPQYREVMTLHAVDHPPQSQEETHENDK